MSLPAKSPGSWYVVVLKTKAFSLAKIAIAGGIGGEGTYPTPDLGRRCVCCDTADVTSRQYDPGSDRFEAAPLEIPICRACDAHVSKSTAVEQLAGVFLLMAAAGLFWSIHVEAWNWAALGAAATFAFVAWGARRILRRRDMAAHGHHIGLEISASLEMCSVRTTNPRLAAEVVERNKALVHLSR
jgi:hypothetical protein